MPNLNFEEQVIAKLHAKQERQESLRYASYSFLSFLLFTILGLLICFQLKTQLKVISHQTFILIFQIGFVSCFLIYTDYFIRFLKHRFL